MRSSSILGLLSLLHSSLAFSPPPQCRLVTSYDHSTTSTTVGSTYTSVTIPVTSTTSTLTSVASSSSSDSSTATASDTTTSSTTTSSTTTSGILTSISSTTTSTTASSCTSVAPTGRAFPPATASFTASTFYLGATYIDSYPCDYTTEEEAPFQQSLGRYALNQLVTGRSTPYDFLYFSETTETTASKYTINNDGWLLDATTQKVATSYTGWKSQFVYWDYPDNIDYDDDQVPAVCSISSDAVLSCNVDGMDQFSICFVGKPSADFGKLFLTKDAEGQGDPCRGVIVQALPALEQLATPSATTSTVAPTTTTSSGTDPEVS